MTYTNKQKTQLRKALKNIGYKCRINEKVSPFSDKVSTFISLVLSNGKSYQICKGNVFTAEFYNEHKAAFDIINKFIEENRQEYIMKQWFKLWEIMFGYWFSVPANKMADKDWDTLADLMDGTR